MVERLKIAIQKARALREQVHAEPSADPAPTWSPSERQAGRVEAAWEALEEIEFDPDHLERNRVISHAKNEPAYVAFDVLRTRILRVFRKHGWTRLGITSATKSCGKTFASTNLALSMSRQQNCRTILFDMDLRVPNVARVLGVNRPEPARWFLAGDIPADKFLRRSGPNLALGLNAERVRDSAELILDSCVQQSLEAMYQTYEPDVVIYDLPPMLACDDVLGFVPQVDCVLLVVGGGHTKASEVSECERLLSEQTHLLGVLLNKAEDPDPSKYGYGYY
ncbi:MAG: CpsD/CapB family tyrosine-protein kinase [Pseudomonadota bacterium]